MATGEATRPQLSY